MFKRIVINVLKYSLALGVLSYVVYSNWAPANGKGLGYVWERHVLTGGVGVHWDYLALAAGLFGVAVFTTFIRWYLLVRAQNLELSLFNAVRLGLIGCFFNLLLPSSVGGDIIKAAGLARDQSRRTVAVATVIMDRIIALWGLFWFVGILGSLFWLTGTLTGQGGQESKRIITVTLGLLAVSVVVWLAMGWLSNERAEVFAGRLTRLPKVGGSAAEFWRAVWLYRCQQLCVLQTILLSWLGFVLFVLAFYFCAYTLWSPEMGAMPTLQSHFILVPLGQLVRAIPVFPGGAGIGELGFAKLYVLFKGEETNGLLGSLVQRVVEVFVGLMGCAVYLAPIRTASARPALVPAPVAVENTPTTGWISSVQPEGSAAS